MNSLFIWSDVPGKWSASTQGETESNAKKEHETSGAVVLVENVRSVDGLVALFTRLCEKPEVWNSVSFNTHGSSGQISLGSTSLNLETYMRLENQNFDRLFAKDCVITFDGCSVAEGCAGEYFLVEIGRTLLVSAGGKVRGSTGPGWPSATGGESWHPGGTWVTAHLGPGGTLRLENGTHLHTDKINNRISNLRKNILEYERLGWLQPGERPELDNAAANAAAWMKPDNWDRRFEACKWLDKAEVKLSIIKVRESSFPTHRWR